MPKPAPEGLFGDSQSGVARLRPEAKLEKPWCFPCHLDGEYNEHRGRVFVFFSVQHFPGIILTFTLRYFGEIWLDKGVGVSG